MTARVTETLARLSKRLGLRRDWYLIALAAAIGTVTAFGAAGFMKLLHLLDQHAVEIQDATPFWFLPVIPMVGGLATGILVHYFAREAKGHGVPEVMDALYREKGVIRPRVAVIKSVASACTIGTGGSAGAEGPIIQIGSAVGSTIAQWLRVPRDQAATLLGCGAAAGLAAVFNAPIAGVFFVLEILLRDFSLRTFTPIVVASVFSTAVTQAIYGKNDAIFAVSGSLANYEFAMQELPNYLILGLLCGCVSVLFIRTLYFFEDVYDKIKIHPVLKPVTGGLCFGLLGVVYLQFVHTGTPKLPPFFSNGYEGIRELLEPASYGHLAGVIDTTTIFSPAGPILAPTAHVVHYEPIITTFVMLIVAAICKLIVTCFTLGSGGSGGIFAPSLFLGASAGAAFGITLEHVGLIPAGGSPAAYALVGMAAVVAGSTHAPLTAILILFELTRDVYVLVPIMLAAVVSTIFAQALCRDSIYTLKLRRRGVLVGSAADLTILRRLTARNIAPVPHVEVHPDEPLSKLSQLRGSYHVTDFVVTDHDGDYLGMVTGQDMRTALMEPEAIPYLLVEELIRRDLPVIQPDETLDVVLEKFSKHDVASLPLMAAGADADRRVTGLISRARLMRRYQEELTKTT